MPPLHGVPLRPPTRLRFLVGVDRPVLLDLDRGTRRPVTGLPPGSDRIVWVQAVGADAVIGSSCGACGSTAEIFAVRHGSTVATRIGTGWQLVPARDGRGIWLKSYVSPDRCTLTDLGLDGRVRRPSRPIDCRLEPRAETPQGLLLTPEAPEDGSPPGEAILLTDAGRQQVAGRGRIHAVVGDRLLYGIGPARAETSFLLTDARTGRRQEISRPAQIGDPSDGLVSPDGRYLAVSFDHPAWPGPRQRMDLWLLDLRTLRWQHVPSMPVPAALKATAIAWAPDGRLVLFGEFDDVGTAVAVWRPGQAQLALRTLPPPNRGTTTLVAW